MSVGHVCINYFNHPYNSLLASLLGGLIDFDSLLIDSAIKLFSNVLQADQHLLVKSELYIQTGQTFSAHHWVILVSRYFGLNVHKVGEKEMDPNRMKITEYHLEGTAATHIRTLTVWSHCDFWNTSALMFEHILTCHQSFCVTQILCSGHHNRYGIMALCIDWNLCLE